MPSMSVTRLAEAPRFSWRDEMDRMWTWMHQFLGKQESCIAAIQSPRFDSFHFTIFQKNGLSCF